MLQLVALLAELADDLCGEMIAFEVDAVHWVTADVHCVLSFQRLHRRRDFRCESLGLARAKSPGDLQGGRRRSKLQPLCQRSENDRRLSPTVKQGPDRLPLYSDEHSLAVEALRNHNFFPGGTGSLQGRLLVSDDCNGGDGAGGDC